MVDETEDNVEAMLRPWVEHSVEYLGGEASPEEIDAYCAALMPEWKAIWRDIEESDSTEVTWEPALRSNGPEVAPPVLEKVDMAVRVQDLLSEATITQAFRNEQKGTIEAVYTFPLPLEATLTGFEVEVGGERHQGVVVERVEAEERYEQAVTEGDTPIMIEAAGPGLFTVNLGNLMSGETAVIQYRMVQLLRWRGDRVRLSLPTTIAPRYGSPQEAGLYAHQTPVHGLGAERPFSVRVEVSGILALAEITSPSHEVALERQSGSTVISSVGRPPMDRDFVLSATSAAAEASGALLCRDRTGFVALASFRPDLPDVVAGSMGRTVKIVIDCSGSMSGDSINQARNALDLVLSGLRPIDAFDIVRFGGSYKVLFGEARLATAENITLARNMLGAMFADLGGTEIGAALNAAFDIAGPADLPRDLLLVTDGEVWVPGDFFTAAKVS